ncbi:hypothetical protein IIC38_02315 [candidate division KSB1 bacterium]|nr:hypothetical protein [candidate division KSB1 bacterium]
MQNIFSNPSAENMEQYGTLCYIQEYLKRMNEWSFDTPVLFSLLTTIIIPILIAVLQHMLK